MSERTPFGFEAEYQAKVEWRDDDDPVGWWVGLPHQCGGWTITPNEGGYQMRRVSRAEAMEALTEFIAEARALLAKLAIVADHQDHDVTIEAYEPVPGS